MRQREARQALEPALEAGESVSWSDRPVAGRAFGRGLVGLAATVVVAAGVAYYGLSASAGGSGLGDGLLASVTDGPLADPHLLVPVAVLASLPLLGVGVLVVERAGLNRTAYGITDRRLLAVRGPEGKVLWSLPPEKVAFVEVKAAGSGLGNLAFNRYTGSRSRNQRRMFTFQRIPSPERVAGEARTWLEERRRAAVEDARNVRRIVDARLGFSLDVPSSWREGPPGEEEAGTFHVLSASPILAAEPPGGERLLELRGPLGASLVLDMAPAGTWTFEQARDVGHGLRRALEVTEDHEQVRIGEAHGFSVTYATRLAQPLHRWTTTGPSVEVGLEALVLAHGDAQLRFALGWMTRFEGMRGMLEALVRSFQASEPQPHGEAER